MISKHQKSVNPTPEKVGTLWNGLMMDAVSDVGARVGKAYQNKPWGAKYLLREPTKAEEEEEKRIKRIEKIKRAFKLP